MNKTGVIGATGMLGHHVAKQVNKEIDHDLVVLHRETSNLYNISDLKYESRVADLDDYESLKEAFEGLDYVLNCGAYYPTAPKPLDEELSIAETQMNNFINAVKESKVKKALYLGGAIVIPKSTEGIADESESYEYSPPNKSAYVQVKWMMDQMAIEAGKEGVPIVVGIPSMTFGEYDYGPSTGRLIVHTVNQTLPGYVNGNRNVVYAGDAAKGLFKACLKGKIGERYLITGHNISMQDLVTKIVAIAGHNKMPKQTSLPLAKLFSKVKLIRFKIAGGEVPLLNDTAIAVMSAGQYLNGAKAKSTLGYEPEYSVDEMLETAIKWFQKVGYIKD